MKPGDLVKYRKPSSAIWQAPHDVPNGSIGLIVQAPPNDEDEYVVVMFQGKIRLITKYFLTVIDETR